MSMIVLAAIIFAFLFGACITALVLGARSSALTPKLAAVQAELEAARSALSAAHARLDECSSELRANLEARSTAEREVARLTEQLKQLELQSAQQLRQQERQSVEKLELL